MKLFPSKKSVASLVFATAGMVASVAPTNTLAAIGSLSVSGSGQVLVQPDIAIIRLSVEKTDKVPAVARNNVEQPVAKFYAQLKSLGVDKEQVKAENINIFPQYRYENGKRILAGYTARRIVKVNIDDFSLIPKVIDLAMNVGFNGVDSMNYDLKDKSAVRKEVRALAVKDASEKANSLADGFKVKVVGVNSISYGSIDTEQGRSIMLKSTGLNTVDGVNVNTFIYEPEELRFTDTVDVQFRIDDGRKLPKCDD